MSGVRETAGPFRRVTLPVAIPDQLGFRDLGGCIPSPGVTIDQEFSDRVNQPLHERGSVRFPVAFLDPQFLESNVLGFGQLPLDRAENPVGHRQQRPVPDVEQTDGPVRPGLRWVGQGGFWSLIRSVDRFGRGGGCGWCLFFDPPQASEEVVDGVRRQRSNSRGRGIVSNIWAGCRLGFDWYFRGGLGRYLRGLRRSSRNQILFVVISFRLFLFRPPGFLKRFGLRPAIAIWLLRQPSHRHRPVPGVAQRCAWVGAQS